MKEHLEIRRASVGDTNFIIDSWLRSNRTSDMTVDVPKHTYYINHRGYVESALERSVTICAVSKADTNQIYGWATVELGSEGKAPALHYVYVKHPYRGFGIARTLIKHVLEEDLFAFSHLPEGKFLQMLNKHGHYDPYRFFKGNA